MGGFCDPRLHGGLDMGDEMTRTDAERFESWVLAVMMAENMTREQAELVVAIAFAEPNSTEYVVTG